jgi:hypothetical protein
MLRGMPDIDPSQHRLQLVLLETARHRIRGSITLTRDGYRSRITDVLNAAERDFVALVDATVEVVDGSAPAVDYPFIAVARHQVVLAVPLD